MSEGRPPKPRAERRRVLKAAIANFADRAFTIECTVRNVSTTGARLKVPESVALPDRFDLRIYVDGFEASCEVVWRKGDEVGVRFAGAPRKGDVHRRQIVDPVKSASKKTLRRPPKSDTGDE